VDGRDLAQMLLEPVDRNRVIMSEYNEFGIRRSSALSLRYRVILQLPADKKRFLARIPSPELLPSVSFDKEVLQIYDRVADPFDRHNLAGGKVPRDAGQLAEYLRSHMHRAPQPNRVVSHGDMPKAVLENLRSLGYIE
jgi:hypothetical protein